MHVLRYAVKHGYKDLADEAATHTILRPFTEMREFFGKECHIYYIWVSAAPGFLGPFAAHQFFFSLESKSAYKDQWMTALPWIYTRDIPSPTLHKGGLKECELWQPFRDLVRRDVDCSPSEIARFEDIVAQRIKSYLGSCERCAERARRWGSSVKAKIGNVSAFSTFL